MPNSPERQEEKLTRHPTLAKIIKIVGLAVAAMLLQSCDEENPNEAVLRASQSGYLERVRQDCRNQAMGTANVGGGMLDLSMSARLNDAEILEQKCFEEKGVVTSEGD